MRIFIHLAIVLCTALWTVDLLGQIESLSEDFVVKNFEVDGDVEQDVEATITMVFKGPEAATLVWERNEVFLERNWETAICDPVLCYFPHTNSMKFEIEPDEPFKMTTHLYPYGIPGDSAKVILHMYEEKDPETIYEFTYTFYSDQTSSVETGIADSDRPKLYPNPAGNYFNIENDQSVERIEIFNVVGRLVLSGNYNTGSQIDIGDLQSGLYFVKMFDEHNGIIRTLRLNKN